MPAICRLSIVILSFPLSVYKQSCDDSYAIDEHVARVFAQDAVERLTASYLFHAAVGGNVHEKVE